MSEMEDLAAMADLAALRAEVERLRAYLPLARAFAAEQDFGMSWDETGHLQSIGMVALDALTPEQRARLMESDK